MYDLILKDFGLEDSNVLAVYPYGSRVYGTNTEKSDHDFIVVLKQLVTDSNRLDSRDNPVSITTYLEETFRQRVSEHKIFALECLFCPKELVLKSKLNIHFVLDLSKMRESISEKCSKDWNQAKKRFSDSQGINPVTGERYLRKVYEAKKSLFHCFRMTEFATQIIQTGRIHNFQACNDLWLELYTDPSEEWDHYYHRYHEAFNTVMTNFRKIAPK